MFSYFERLFGAYCELFTQIKQQSMKWVISSNKFGWIFPMIQNLDEYVVLYSQLC